MFSGPNRPEATTAPYSPYDRRPSYSGEQQQQHYSYPQRPQFEPPRPLEPRPTLFSSLSDTTNLPRRHDSYHQPSRGSEQRTPGPSLPGLRDILTPAPVGSGQGPFGGSWQIPTSVPQQVRSQYGSSHPHPPMVLEPQTQHAQDPRPRSWEVPIHGTSSELPHAASTGSRSPYPAYQPEQAQFLNTPHDRERGVSDPTGGHVASGVSTPYSGAAPDGNPFGSAVTGYDHGQPPGTPGASAEGQKKYLGIKEVPGEGSYHLYEGGYRLPTHVDGEHVNPAWGLTKANKPRKRLALACLDCREKKIKCEPGATSCLQCEKAKRPCRRSQAQQQAELAASEWSPNAPAHSRNKASVSDPTPSQAPPREVEPDTVNKRRSREDPSPPNVPHKKHRSASPMSAMMRGAPPVAIRDGATMADTTKPLAMAPNGAAMSWEDDPFKVERQTTTQLLQLYFEHFNNATYALYPRRHFTHWLETSTDKCQNERMVLYAILAVASIFADESYAGFGRQCARVTLDILPHQVGNINLCVAQARMLLSIYCFAKGEDTAAWEHSGAAIRTVQWLNYHTEAGCLEGVGGAPPARCEFNFSPMQLVECRRRTFWSAFLMDRFAQGAVTVMKPQDIFLRLPCVEEAYEDGQPSDAPYSNNGIIDPIKSLLTAESRIAPMGWHVLVAAIWGDVLDFLFRAPYQAASTYGDFYESFYADTSNRLQGWLSRLPESLQYSQANLDQSIKHGYAGTFISIHALYHLCCMKLNRCLRHSLARDRIARNVRAAHSHGHQVLQLMATVNAAREQVGISSDRHAPNFVFSTPFPGYATLAAIDIVSAGGPDSALGSTQDDISAGLLCLQELARLWHSARVQARICERRFYEIQNILKSPLRARGGAWLGRNWGTEKPLERDLCADDDCIYGLGGSTEAMQIYFDAFGDTSGRQQPPAGGLRLV